MIDAPPPFDHVWLRVMLGAVIGGCLGSFTTMLAYRVPRGLSIVTPRSHCPQCGVTLGPRDLVPLLSFLSTGGHCRHCRAPIGWRYLWIEIAFTLTGGLLALWT